MTDRPAGAVQIVGAGLAGPLLASMLARRGHAITLFDRRPDPRLARQEQGRSINLALAARGIHALEHAGLMHRIQPLLIPMRGRMIHDRSGRTELQPYGQRTSEVIYSIGRAALNRVLIEAAARSPRVALRFEQTCLGVRGPHAPRTLAFQDRARGEYEIPLRATIAADGAGSAVRASLAAAGQVRVSDEWLDHEYKELTLPPRGGRHVLEPHALHIWPRGGFMLIALPNTDASFTATLFLAREGPDSFATLATGQHVVDFFEQQFPDVVPLIPDMAVQFLAHPAGRLGTVSAAPWRVGGDVLLLGDAAHAIVPFHGQGMNAAFEDCALLESLLPGSEPDWLAVYAEFETRRRPDTEAIAAMALQNYAEMRATVLDPVFVRRRALGLELEKRFPDRFIPRYSMVAFHPEIPYSEALRRGTIEAQILAELDPGPERSSFDVARAEKLISERLPPLGGPATFR